MKKKTRTLKQIHRGLLSTREAYNRLSPRHSAWIEASPKQYWGRTDDPLYLINYEVDAKAGHECSSTFYKYSPNYARCMPDDELPLYINEPSMAETIKGRLNGTIKPSIPHRQDLVDEGAILQIRYDHIFAVRQTYQQLLQKYARPLILKHKKKSQFYSGLYMIKVEGTAYFIKDEPNELRIYTEEDTFLLHSE